MSAVLTSENLGLFNSSFDVLGRSGLLGLANSGQGNTRTYINAATGNLVIQRRDEILIGQGIDTSFSRFYNSLAQLDGDNGDNWRISLNRSLSFTGTPNTAGSTVTRTAGDGSETLFVYDSAAGAYVSQDGSGAHNRITYNSGAGEWTWTSDGGVSREVFDASGVLRSVFDRDGNETVYAYDAGRLSTVTQRGATPTDDQITRIFYESGTSNIAYIEQESAGSTTSRVSYGYDANNRLETITVDLTPANSSDSVSYVTTYTYDGNSNRVASMQQSDGTSVSFSYQLVGGDYRLSTMTDAEGRVTQYNYNLSDINGNYTEVVLATGATTKIYFDADGYLTRVENPAVDGQRSVLQYTYDADNNLLSVTDGQGNVTLYTYDARGNRISAQDSAGNRTEWTYTAGDQASSETLYQVADPDGAGPASAGGAATQRWVYDSEGHLQFSVSATGTVTEYSYDAPGNLVAERVYLGASYSLAGLQPGDTLSAAALQSWAGGQDLARTSLAEFTYDFRGQLASDTRWERTDSSGDGMVGTDSVSRFVYDQTGKLLRSIAARGELTTAEDYVQAYGYDGLDRVISSIGPEGQQVTSVYTDSVSGTTVRVQDAEGLITTSSYDGTGQLVSVARSNAASADYGRSEYTYTLLGQLASTLNSAGGRSYNFYDDRSRLVYTVDESGAVIQTEYNDNDQVTRQTEFALTLDTSSWYDTNSSTLTVNTSDLVSGVFVPVQSAGDRTVSYSYDTANRLESRTDGVGLAEYFYDGAGRVVRVEAGALNGSVAERVTRTFYDDVGRTVASLDSGGYLRVNNYDDAGRLTSQTAFANEVLAANRDSDLGTILAAQSTDADDQTSYNYYDGRGILVANVDAERYLTNFGYDKDGNQVSVRRFVNRVATGDLGGVAPPVVTNDANDQLSTFEYDESGRLRRETDYQGLISTYEYDNANKLIRNERFATNGDGTIRRRFLSYDEVGRLTGELDAEQAATLGANPTDAQINASVASDGVQNVYDTAGRLASVVDEVGNRSLFFYDSESQLRYTVNARGEVRESIYNAFGEVETEISYAGRISVAGLNGGAVTSTLTSRVAAIASESADRRTDYHYNSRGLLAQAVRNALNAANQVVQVTSAMDYDAWGQLVRSGSDADFAASRTIFAEYVYDDRGMLVEGIQAAGTEHQSVRSDYDAFGRVVSTIDANGRLTTYDYDRLGRSVLVTDPLNREAVTSYDAFGRVLTTRDALDRVTTFQYDDVQRTTTITLPGNIQTTTRSNEFGETVEVIDGENNSTLFSYDLNGNLRSTTNTVNGVEQSVDQDYDSADKLILATDADGREIRYEYDGANRLLRQIADPDGQALTTEYEYDGLGQRTRTIDPEGRITDLRFDLDGNIFEQITDPLGAALTTRFEYDARGNQLAVVRATGPTTESRTEYLYDDLNRLVQEVRDTGPTDLNLTKRYFYDDNGNVVAREDEAGNASFFEYDSANRLRYSVDALGYVTETVYDDLDRVVEKHRYVNPIALPALPTFVDPTTVSVNAPQPQVLEAQAADITGPVYAAGNVSITGQQSSVSFPASVANPVVIVGPATRNEVDMGVVRVSGVASDQFNVQFQEYDYLDGVHASETISYMVLEEGRHVLPDGTIWEVGTASVSGSGFSTINFSQAFAGTPKLFVTSQTVNELTPAVVRARNLSAGSVQLRMREDEATRGTGHVAETVGYLAIYSPTDGGDIQGNAYTTQSLNATHNAASLDGNINLFVEEEQSANSELNHITESIDALQFGGLLFANMTTRAGGDTAGTRIHSLTTAPQIGELSLGTPAVAGGEGEHVYIADSAVPSVAFSVPDLAGNDRSSVHYYFDAAGNVSHSIDENRYVTGFTYDDNGRLLTSTRYENDVDLVALSDLSALQAQIGAGGAKTTSIRYDEVGREWLITDASGGITEYRYDRAGNLIETLQFSANTTVTYPMDASLADRGERFFYDATGRQAYVLDDVGNLMAYSYTDSGEVSAVHTYGRSLVPDLTTATTAAQVESALTAAGVDSTDAARSTYSFYDGVGRERFSIDGLGRVTEREYDAGGRMVSLRQHEFEPSITTAVTTATLAQDLVSEPSRQTQYVYDDVGRLRFTIDAENRVIEQQYDSRGNVEKSLQHLQPFAGGPITETALSTTYNAAAELTARVTERVYDDISRVERTIDALDQVERFEYDAFGNRTALINKANLRWEYDYDAAGNLVEERSPTETFYRNSGSTSALTTVSGQLVSRNAYDHLGNVISRTEGVVYNGTYDFSDASETTYDYDSLGRQVGVNYPDLDGNSVSTLTRYDDFGNAVANIDARGNVSYKAYDDLGRERFHVDAEGYVTEYRYDALGNRSSLIRYASQQTILLGTILTTHTEADLMSHMQGAGSANDRVLTYEYDAAGQLTRIVEPSVSTFNPETGTSANVSPETVFVYDQFGDVVRENRRLSASGVWASTYRYYNDLGQRTAEVDALGYLTTSEFNAFGEAERVTEYARALDLATVSEASQPAPPVASSGTGNDASIGADRARRFVFDNLGRVIEEYVADVSYFTYAGVGSGTAESGEVRVLATAYDAVGNVTTLTDVAGNTSETRFNALGHAEWSKDPAREVLRSVVADASDGINTSATLDQSLVSETPFTSYRYDVFGNVLSIREHAIGAGPGETSVNESPEDRVTYFAYNGLRLKSEEVDANGDSTFLTYDVAGHVTSERRGYQGRTSANPGQAAAYTAETQYEYDALGQQITTRVLLGDSNQLNFQSVSDQAVEVAYNAFGEVIARGTNRTSFEETFQYDNAGRVTQALNAQGKPVSYSYDVVGNLTRESSATSGDRVYFYDALGRGVRVDNEIIAQDFSDPSTTYTGSSTVLDYDRWGNTVRQANRSVFWEDLALPPTQTEQTVYEYHYNRFDQLTFERRPETMIVEEDGNEGRGTPTQTYFYDIQGRQIAEQDTRGSLRFNYYNSAGQLLEEIDALGNSTRYAHNIFGEQVAKENALGYVSTTEYDRLGQAIRIGDVRFDANTAAYNQVLITHTYNELGHQVSSAFAHSLEDDGQGGFATKNVTSYSDYDSRGNLVRSQSATGVVMTYAYDSQGRRVLQRNDGIYTSSVNPNRDQLTWSYDYFGQAQAYNDLSGRQFYFDYDTGTGLLERRYQNGETAPSQGINYTYYDNGALKSVDDNELNVLARYEYDAQGRRSYEYVEGQDQRSLIYRQETTSQYDEHGRIARVITTDLEDNLVKMDATYGYDEEGNRRYVRVVSNYDPTFVNPTNNAPVVNTGIAAQTVMETQTVSLPLGQNLFSDPDGHSMSYSMFVATGEYEFVWRQGELIDFWNVTGTENPPSWMSLAVDAQNRFSLEIDNPPTNASANNSNSSNGTAGQYRIYIQATDEFGKSITQFFNLQVEDYVEVNLAPVVGTNIPNQSATEGSPFTYAIPGDAFTDPNGHPLQYAAYRVTTEWVQTQPYPEPDFELQEVENPLPAWLSFNAQTGTFSGTRNGLTADETLDIRVYAIEQGTAEAFRVAQDFVLTVEAQNDAPVYSSGLAAQYVAQPNTPFDLDLAATVFTDPNGDTLTYSASGYPSWVTFDAGAVRFTGTPTAANLGVSTITLTATDPDGASASRTFDLRVNSAPVRNTAIPNGSTQVTRAYNLDVSGNFGDPDGDTLTFSAVQEITQFEPEIGEVFTFYVPLPTWLTLNSNGQFSGTPPSSESGSSYTIIVTATDGYSSVTDEFVLNVTPYVNVAPVVNTLLANQSVQETGSGTYTFPSNAFTDADGHSLTYTARLSSGALLPSWITFSASQRRFTFNPAYGNAGAYDIRVTANDGNGGTVNDVFRVTVTDGPNRAPVLSIPIPNRSATEAVTSYYTVPSNTFYDPDGDGLTYTARFSTGATLPSWISFNPSTRLFTFSPAYGNAGTYDIRVTANDGNGGTQSDVFRLTVGAGANRLPSVGTLIPNLSANEGQAFSYTVPSNAFTDPDGNSFSYTAFLVTQQLVQTQPYPEPEFELIEIETALPSWLTFNPSTRTFSGTRNGITTDEVLDIRLYATEVGTAESYRVSQEFSLTVQAANDAPVLSNPPQSTYIAAPGSAYTLDLPSNVFTDPNGDSLTYSASGLPSWLSFTASTVRFTGTPSTAHIGASTITLTATDPDGASRSTTFTLRVNSAPVVSSFIPNTSTQANRAISLNVASNFSDPDGQTLTFSAVQEVTEYEPELGEFFTYFAPLPSWLSLNSNGQFAGTPPTSEVNRSYTIRVTASDGFSTVRDTFVLNIIAYQNIAPVVNSPLVNQSVQETGSRTYTFPSNAFTDADGNSLTYSARLSNGALLPSWMSFSSSLRRFTFNPAYGNAGTYDVRVTANDGNGGTVNDIFRVTVTNGPNRAPVVSSAIPNQTAGIGNAFSYTFPINTFSDADGNALTYTASTPSWMSFNAGLRRFTGTPTSAGTYNVTVTASDGQYSVSDTFSVTVSASNSAPVLSTPIPNQFVLWPEGLYVASSLYFSDPDGDSLTYTLVNPPTGVYINSSGIILGLPIDPITSVTVRASDGQYTVQDSFIVRVEGGGGGGPRDPFFFNSTSGAAATESRTLSLDKSESPAPATQESALPLAQTNNLFGFGPNNPYEFIEDGFFYNGGYSIYDPAAFISTNTKEYWYTYDAENRITLSEGVLVGGIGGTIEIQARDSQAGVDEQGQIISYDAVGNQVMRISYNGTLIDADRFVYNTRGELIESQRRTNAAFNVEWLVESARDAAYLDDSLWQSSTEYSYDLAGRTVRQVDYYQPGELRQIEVISLEEDFGLPEESIPFDQTISIDVSGAVKNATYTTYDDDGRVQSIENRDVGKGYWPSQYIFEEQLPTGPGQSVDTSLFLPTEARLITTSRVLYGSDGSNGIPAYTAYDGAGRLAQYTYQKVRRHEGDTDDLSSYNLNYAISYQGFDSYKQSLIFGSGSNENQKNGSTFSSYDDLGRVLTTQESYAAIDQYQKRFFRHNGDGQIINKISGESDSSSGPWTFEPDGTDERHYYFSGGELIGSVDGRGRILFEDQAAYRVVSRDSTSSTQTYSVRQGDTLRSIARVVFGSSSLWYLIADANGLADDSVELVEGQQLKIPGFNSNVNDASAFKAFNAEEIIGDRTPAVPYVPPPPPSKDDGCGVIGAIIVAVVAIVVTVYTAGVAATAFGAAPAGSSAFAAGVSTLSGGAIAAGGVAVSGAAAIGGAAFVGGFAGSVASQLVGNALGVVDGFSFRSALASGLTSAFSAGIGSLGGAGTLRGVQAGEGLKVAGQLAARGAATYLSSQAAQVLTGQETSFSWKGLAASAAGSVLGDIAAIPFGEPESFTGKLVQGFASGAAAAVASKALGVTGRIELQAIAIDSFSNTLANSFVDAQVENVVARDQELARDQAMREKMEDLQNSMQRKLDQEIDAKVGATVDQANQLVTDSLTEDLDQRVADNMDEIGWGGSRVNLEPPESKILDEIDEKIQVHAAAREAEQSSVSSGEAVAEIGGGDPSTWGPRVTQVPEEMTFVDSLIFGSTLSPSMNRAMEITSPKDGRTRLHSPESGEFVRDPFSRDQLEETRRRGFDDPLGLEVTFDLWEASADKAIELSPQTTFGSGDDFTRLGVILAGEASTSGGFSFDDDGLALGASSRAYGELSYASGQAVGDYGQASFDVGSTAELGAGAEGVVRRTSTGGVEASLGLSGNAEAVALKLQGSAESAEVGILFGILEVQAAVDGDLNIGGIGIQGEAGIKTLKTKPGIAVTLGAGLTAVFGGRVKGSVQVSFNRQNFSNAVDNTVDFLQDIDLNPFD